jgi:hypothetical protein
MAMFVMMVLRVMAVAMLSFFSLWNAATSRRGGMGARM